MRPVESNSSPRGPVIGPLVMAGVLVHESKEKELQAIGVKDSKLLPEKKRVELFEKIQTVVDGYKIITVSANELDDMMKRFNLNLIEAKKSVEIIDSLNGQKVILDCPSVNVNAYANCIKANIKDKNKEIIAEHKADEKYVTVGAASILAKVTRDRIINELKQKYNLDFGSGYMSDEKTQAFIDKHFEEYPELFRRSWASWKTRNQQKNQRKLGDF